MNEKTWLIIYVVIGWLTALVIELQCIRWKNKHAEAITAWTIESNNKDKQILKLQEELENLKEKSVKHGRWIARGDDMWLCSNCKENIIFSMHESDRIEKQRYCCKCGARMDLKDGDTE